jgi:hypothetical protein
MPGDVKAEAPPRKHWSDRELIKSTNEAECTDHVFSYNRTEFGLMPKDVCPGCLRDAAKKAQAEYFTLADAVCRESTGVEDACRQSRETRAEIERWKAQALDAGKTANEAQAALTAERKRQAEAAARGREEPAKAALRAFPDSSDRPSVHIAYARQVTERAIAQRDAEALAREAGLRAEERERCRVEACEYVKGDTCDGERRDGEYCGYCLSIRRLGPAPAGKPPAPDARVCARCASSDRSLDADFHCSTCYANAQAEIARLKARDAENDRWMVEARKAVAGITAGSFTGHPVVDCVTGLKGEIARLKAEGSDDKLTVKSLACMLGWGNVPPREVLERSVSALKLRLDVVGRQRDEALAERTAERERSAGVWTKGWWAGLDAAINRLARSPVHRVAERVIRDLTAPAEGQPLAPPTPVPDLRSALIRARGTIEYLSSYAPAGSFETEVMPAILAVNAALGGPVWTGTVQVTAKALKAATQRPAEPQFHEYSVDGQTPYAAPTSPQATAALPAARVDCEARLSGFRWRAPPAKPHNRSLYLSLAEKDGDPSGLRRAIDRTFRHGDKLSIVRTADLALPGNER